MAALLFFFFLANSAAAQSASDESVSECNTYMEAFNRSAARKLYRAFSGHDFTLKPVSLQSRVELDVETDDGTKTINFEVLGEKNGRVAALVDVERTHRTTLVVAETVAGPLVTTFAWPSESAIRSGKDCTPVDSRIEAPDVPLSRIVDTEPFKFWGLRVLWRLPPSFSPSSSGDDEDLREVIADVVE